MNGVHFVQYARLIRSSCANTHNSFPSGSIRFARPRDSRVVKVSMNKLFHPVALLVQAWQEHACFAVLRARLVSNPAY